jgi:hypothetical protein
MNVRYKVRGVLQRVASELNNIMKLVLLSIYGYGLDMLKVDTKDSDHNEARGKLKNIRRAISRNESRNE